ncbi:MAG: hypothetical protein ACLP9N_16010, partial [Mycobacterium sp.]
ELGITPACGALVAPIELATGKKPYFVGKPNPLMMWPALGTLQAGPADAFMVSATAWTPTSLPVPRPA